MKKNQYIVPETIIVVLNISDGILAELSGKGITSGGSAEASGQNVAGVKSQDSYNVWDDDWSK